MAFELYRAFEPHAEHAIDNNSGMLNFENA